MPVLENGQTLSSQLDLKSIVNSFLHGHAGTYVHVVHTVVGSPHPVTSCLQSLYLSSRTCQQL